MKLKELLHEVPDMTEEKFQENVGILIERYSKFRIPLFRDKEWTAEELIAEWELIQQKQSNLSRSKRDTISGLVSMALYNMVKSEPKDNSEYVNYEEVNETNQPES